MMSSYLALLSWSFLLGFLTLWLISRRFGQARNRAIRRKKGGALQPLYVRGNRIADEQETLPR